MLFGHLTKRRLLLTLLFLLLAVAQFAPAPGMAGHVRAAGAHSSMAASTAAHSSSSQGNSGDIKIEGGQPDQGGQGNDQNDPHVQCQFYIQGFNMAVAQGTITIEVWDPTSGAGTTALTDTYNGTATAAGTFEFVNGPYTLPAGHYKAFVTDNKGEEIAKHKVFWVDQCATTASAATPTAIPTSTPTATPTNTPTSTATNTPTNTPPSGFAPPQTSTPVISIQYVYVATPTPITVVQYVAAATPTPLPTYTPAPTYTPISQVASVKVVIKTRYRTVTRTHYRTVTRMREITRVRMLVKTRYVLKTRLRYRYLTRITHLTRVRTLLHHKLVVTTKVRYLTVVRFRTRIILQHKTVLKMVLAYRYLQHPKTGRFAGPLLPWHGGIPPVEARMSIARLGIRWAPVWARAFLANGDGSFRYDIVPFYGVTRFGPSARFGQAGLTLLSGHDDIDGQIFRYLDQLRRGDVIRVWEGRHAYRYVVRLVQIVAPDDVRLLNAHWLQPTLALISCTPYWVDTQRVVVIAELR